MEDAENKKLYLEKEILAPYTHVLQISGKQLRVKIVLAFNHWLKLPDDKLHYIIDTAHMLHNSTLLMDDIQDDANVRRGLPASHRLYGTPMTLNAVVHVGLLVLQRLVKLGPMAVEIYSEEFLNAVRGQGFELYWRDNFVCPTEEEYRKMAREKTGRMLLLGVRLCQLFSECKTDLSQLALHIGSYFQIRDDYCNLTEREALEEWPGKEDKQACKDNDFCEDLTEGKYSLPIIHAMNTSERDEILNILRRRTNDVVMKKYCLSLLEKVGSLQYTRNVLSDLDRTARAEITRLGGNPELEAVLDELLSWKI